MKTTIISGSIVVLALWFGYNRGYHQGVQNERRAWESTAQRDTSIVTLDHNTSQRPQPILYKNPHLGIVVVAPQGEGPVNAPDPRNLPFK